ncbi:TPA: hypothetical protein ACGZ99_003665, partial [Elizabethkingia anophelis]
GNSLDIILRHKVAQITTILKSTVIGNDITAIDNAMITPHYTNGTIPLASGSITGRTDMTNTPITFPISTPGLSQRALPAFVNTDTGGDATASFSATVMSGGISHAMSVPNSFKITPGVQSSLTVSLTKCGAFIAPNEWKDFMCHNLGADYSADPFVPSAAIEGARYQWGARTGETGSYYSQADSQANPGNIYGWLNLPAKPDGTWSDISKTINDPCPSGYKVPSQAQWQGIMTNNPNVEKVGTWSTGEGDVNNYTAAIYLGTTAVPRTLMLVAAGIRLVGTTDRGRLVNHGITGYYWSSTYEVNQPNFASVFSISSSPNTLIANLFKTHGINLRCIKE